MPDVSFTFEQVAVDLLYTAGRLYHKQGEYIESAGAFQAAVQQGGVKGEEGFDGSRHGEGLADW